MIPEIERGAQTMSWKLTITDSIVPNGKSYEIDLNKRMADYDGHGSIKCTQNYII